MNWQSITRVGWKIVAIISIPILIIIIIAMVSRRHGGKTEQSLPITNSNLPKPSAPNLWSGARVPFTIEPYMEDAKLLITKNAMKVFQNKTCVVFDEKKPSDEKWLSFIRNDEICTDVNLGMEISKKGEEKIQFGLDCLTVSKIQRALGRSIGLEYEDTRPDRNKFISYEDGCSKGNSQNKNLSAISSFHNEAALEISFDFTSHMFNGVKCLLPKNPGGIKIGSSDDPEQGTFSVLDFEKINAIYDCPGCNSYRFRPVSKVTESAHSFESFKPVHAGHDLDRIQFYICRVYHLGSLLIGKLKVTPEEVLCWIADSGKEYRYGRRFKVLTNPRSANLTWISQVGQTIPSNAIRGGRTADRATLYIGRCSVPAHGKTTVIPGYINPGTNVFKVPFGHLAHTCPSYEILVCNE